VKYNIHVKKICLVIALALFSIQAYAGSCPDGSDPVRSISADGTYFVYNCGNNNNEQKSSSTTSLITEINPVNHSEEASINVLSFVMVTVVHFQTGTIVRMTDKELNLPHPLFLQSVNNVWLLVLC